MGVSAGIDSMVLLHLLCACRRGYDLSLIVAYVNHGLRPGESEKEAELVQKEAGRLGLPFEYGVFEVKEFQRTRGFSLQDAARRIRFRFFNDLLEKYDGEKIALGHNADDQVETVLLRLIRGSGLKGLKGMLPIREGRVIRPLLETWRREIELFAEQNKIPFLQDSSNLKEGYLRNRIRLTLIPFIERNYQSNFKRVLLRTSAILREEDDYLEREGEQAYHKIVYENGGILSFKFSDFKPLHRTIQRRVVQKMLRRICSGEMEDGDWFEGESIDSKLRNPPPSFVSELPFGISLEKRYDLVFLAKRKPKPIPPFEVELVAPGRTLIQEIGREMVVEVIDRNDLLGEMVSPDLAHLDYEHLQFPLKVRNFRPGDRFDPLGAKGTQKLKEFFIDHKIPRMDRPGIPLLLSGEKIAWVVGHRIGERFKITPTTHKILRIKMV